MTTEEYKQTILLLEERIKNLKIKNVSLEKNNKVMKARENFIDWVIDHHEDVVKEYLKWDE